MIPEYFIQNVLYRTNLVDIIGRYILLRKKGINLVGICPFHNENTPSFVVSPSKQIYHCFGCGEHGNAISFLMKYSGVSFQESLRELANNANYLPEDNEIKNNNQIQNARKIDKIYYKILDIALSHYINELRTSSLAIEYLKLRGITGNIAKYFGLGWANNDYYGLRKIFKNYYTDSILIESGLVVETDSGNRYDRFRGRIMFPIRSMENGNVIAFGGRTIGKNEPKYINSSETLLFLKGNELYGLWEARHEIRKKNFILIVEGYMDVIGLAQRGINNVVASLGTSITINHINKLLLLNKNLIFCFDGDVPGKKAAWRALLTCLPILKDHIVIRFIFLPDKQDPDSYIRKMGVSMFQEIINNAIPLSKFFLNELSLRNTIHEAEGRANCLLEAKSLLNSIPECMLRFQIEYELAKLVRLDITELKSFLRKDRNLEYAQKQERQIKKLDIIPSLAKRLVSLLLLYPDLLKSINNEQIETLSYDESFEVVKDLIILLKKTNSFSIEAISKIAHKHSKLQTFLKDLETSINREEKLPCPQKEWDDALCQIEFERIYKDMTKLAKSGLSSYEERQRYQYLSQKAKFIRKTGKF
ncbi:MAG: DNA primase [Bordetella sp.]|nr:MAG: DNA primase [Bordetella sp.]